MSEPLITAAKHVTGKILAGNPYMPQNSKFLMNQLNESMYGQN